MADRSEGYIADRSEGYIADRSEGYIADRSEGYVVLIFIFPHNALVFWVSLTPSPE